MGEGGEPVIPSEDPLDLSGETGQLPLLPGADSNIQQTAEPSSATTDESDIPEDFSDTGDPISVITEESARIAKSMAKSFQRDHQNAEGEPLPVSGEVPPSLPADGYKIAGGLFSPGVDPRRYLALGNSSNHFKAAAAKGAGSDSKSHRAWQASTNTYRMKFDLEELARLQKSIPAAVESEHAKSDPEESNSRQFEQGGVTYRLFSDFYLPERQKPGEKPSVEARLFHNRQGVYTVLMERGLALVDHSGRSVSPDAQTISYRGALFVPEIVDRQLLRELEDSLRAEYPFTKGEYRLKSLQARVDGESLTVEDVVADVRDIRAAVDRMVFGDGEESQHFKSLFEQGEAVKNFQRENRGKNQVRPPAAQDT